MQQNNPNKGHNKIIDANQESQRIDVQGLTRHAASQIVRCIALKEHNILGVQRGRFLLEGLEFLFADDVWNITKAKR